MGLRRNNKLLIHGGFGASSMNDSTPYYFSGYFGSVTGTEARERMYVPCALKIKAVEMAFFASGAAGTQEDVDFKLRINNTSDTDLFLEPFAAGGVTHLSKYDLNIDLAAGEFFNIKMTTPAWVTNPVNLYCCMIIYCECME